MYIRSVSLTNFRCYRQAETTFVHPGSGIALPTGGLKNVTLLIGVNGSGKTSVLRGVALATIAPVINESGYYPRYLVRRSKVGSDTIHRGKVSVVGLLDGRETSRLDPQSVPRTMPDSLNSQIEIIRKNDYETLQQFIHVHGSGTPKLSVEKIGSKFYEKSAMALVKNSNTKLFSTTNIEKAMNDYHDDFSSSFFALGYGADRRVEMPNGAFLASSVKLRGRRYLRVAGLFEEGAALSPLPFWLPQLKETRRHGEIVKLLNRTLPIGTRFTGEFLPDQQPVFRQGGVDLPFTALSDGYRSYVGLLGDILFHLNDCCPNDMPLTELTGVVMVDDIDLHLHPQWQRVVVPRLAKAFPKLQFILTTHSPLVVGSVHAANVRVIGKNKIHQFSERLHGLSVDQILSSPYFGHTAPRSDESERQLQELLEGPVDAGDAGPALAFLKELAGEGRPPK